MVSVNVDCLIEPVACAGVCTYVHIDDVVLMLAANYMLGTAPPDAEATQVYNNVLRLLYCDNTLKSSFFYCYMIFTFVT